MLFSQAIFRDFFKKDSFWRVIYWNYFPHTRFLPNKIFYVQAMVVLHNNWTHVRGFSSYEDSNFTIGFIFIVIASVVLENHIWMLVNHFTSFVYLCLVKKNITRIICSISECITTYYVLITSELTCFFFHFLR